MADEVLVQPGDVVVVADPAPAVEMAVIETATAEAVATGVRVATEDANQWQRQGFELMESLLSETREQRAELQAQIQEVTLRVKDQTEQLTVMNARLAELAPAPSLAGSPTSTLATDPTIVEQVVVTDTTERSESSTGKPNSGKSETPEPPAEKLKPKRRLI